MCKRTEKAKHTTPEALAGWFLPKRDPCSAFFNILPAPNQSFLFSPSFARVVGRERKTTLKCCFFRTKTLTGVFFIKAWCRTGLEVGPKMIRTLPKCLWHLFLCGCHLPRVSGEVEGTALLLQQEQGALLRRNHPKVWGAQTTAWQVGMGGISCFKGGTACPVGHRQDGFADK